MSWAITVLGNGGSSATSPRTITATGVVGRLYVVVASRSTATDPITTVTDTGGNTWTRVHFAPTSGSQGRRIEHWRCIPTTGFTSVSVAFTGAGLCQATLIELTGHDAADLVEAENSGTRAASTTPTEYQVTVNENNCMVIAAIQWNTNTDSIINAQSGWTKLTGGNNAGPSIAYRTDLASGTTDGCSWTLTGGSSVGSGHSIVAYNMAVTGLAVTVWDGATEQPATLEGVWNGSTIDPAFVEQVTT